MPLYSINYIFHLSSEHVSDKKTKMTEKTFDMNDIEPISK